MGGTMGLIKYLAFDRPAYQRKLALTSSTQRYSPWTHLTADAPDPINPLGAVVQNAGAGASLGQSLDKAASDKNLQDAMAKNMNSMSNFYGQSAPPVSPGGMNYGTQAKPSSFWGDYVKSPDEMMRSYSPSMQPTTPDDMFKKYGGGY